MQPRLVVFSTDVSGPSSRFNLTRNVGELATNQRGDLSHWRDIDCAMCGRNSRLPASYLTVKISHVNRSVASAMPVLACRMSITLENLVWHIVCTERYDFAYVWFIMNVRLKIASWLMLYGSGSQSAVRRYQGIPRPFSRGSVDTFL